MATARFPKCPTCGQPVPSGASKYRGVTWDKRIRKWRVRIRHGGKLTWVADFPLEAERDAALAYDRIAEVLHGRRARLNFPVIR